MTGLITECFPLSASPGSVLWGPRASPRLLGLREEGSSQSRKGKAGKAFPFLSRTGQQVAGVLTGFGCVLRLNPVSLPFSVGGDHVIFISALCGQGRTFQKVLIWTFLNPIQRPQPVFSSLLFPNYCSVQPSVVQIVVCSSLITNK